MSRRALRRWCIALAVFFAAYFALRTSRAAMTALWYGAVLPAEQWLGRLCGRLTLSVGEVLILTAVFCAILWLANVPRRIIAARGRRWGMALRLTLTALCAVLTVYAGFCLTWGIGYNTDSFQEKSGIHARPSTAETLAEVTAYFAGNLAAWAAIYLPAELQKDRLLSAYNNDGPGFARDMLDTPEYRRVADKLHTYIPESSIVGVLLEHAEDYAVIDSANRSIMQHEPLSWSVVGTRFVHLGQRSQMGRLSDDVLREWIGSMTPAEREQFTDALFDVLSLSGKARTLDDLRGGGLAGGAALLKQYAGADDEKKKIIAEIFRRLGAGDVKDEMKTAAGAGVEGVKTGLTNLTTG